MNVVRSRRDAAIYGIEEMRGRVPANELPAHMLELPRASLAAHSDKNRIALGRWQKKQQGDI